MHSEQQKKNSVLSVFKQKGQNEPAPRTHPSTVKGPQKGSVLLKHNKSIHSNAAYKLEVL